jgi:RNA polymerase sigma-70 factor (ECF subfamily)
MADDTLRLWAAWRTRRDERAFEELVLPDLGRAVALTRAEGCPQAEAEDAVQESLIRLAREDSDTPARVGVRGWFFGVVRDRARSRRRGDRRRRRREREAALPEAGPGEAPRLELREEVDRALAGLPEEERESLRLRFLLDLEYREVAHVLGISRGACRMRVLRALKRIRGTLGTGAGAALAAVLFPAPARASSLITTAVSSAPATAVASIGGTAVMTMTQKSLLGAAAAGLLGTALGAGAMSLVDSSDMASERARTHRELVALRKEVADARAERDRLAGNAGARREEGEPPVPGRDPLASRVDPKRERTEGAPGGAGPASNPAADASAELQKRAGDLSRKWVEHVVQIRDEGMRNEAIAAIRSALSSGDQVQVLAGLFAVSAIGHVPYDKVSMRSLVLAQFEAEDVLLRKAAVRCVLATSQGQDPSNLELLLRLKDDPSPLVRRELAPAVSWAARGDLRGEAGIVVLRVMKEIEAEEAGAPPRGGKSEFIRQLGGRTYFRNPSPEIEERILALARDPATQESALHFFFQNMEKSSKVVDLLIEIAEGGGPNSANATRALTYEVPTDQVSRVAAFLVKVLETGPAGQVQQVLFGLRNFGTEAELPAMERLAANELLDASTRRMIAETAEFIRRRASR